MIPIILNDVHPVFRILVTGYVKNSRTCTSSHLALALAANFASLFVFAPLPSLAHRSTCCSFACFHHSFNLDSAALIYLWARS
jgi:hypothetical protein